MPVGTEEMNSVASEDGAGWRALAAYGRRGRLGDNWSTFNQEQRHEVMCDAVQQKQSRAFMDPMPMDALKKMSIKALLELWTEAHLREERITMRSVFERIA